MSAAKQNARTNTPTEQNTEDNKLVLYRLGVVEGKVDGVIEKLDARENIKKADLIEFKTAILERIGEKFVEVGKDIDALQAQINELKKNKADLKDVVDLKGLVKGVGAIFGSIIVGLVVYYLTVGNK